MSICIISYAFYCLLNVYTCAFWENKTDGIDFSLLFEVVWFILRRLYITWKFFFPFTFFKRKGLSINLLLKISGHFDKKFLYNPRN